MSAIEFGWTKFVLNINLFRYLGYHKKIQTPWTILSHTALAVRFVQFVCHIVCVLLHNMGFEFLDATQIPNKINIPHKCIFGTFIHPLQCYILNKSF